LRQAFQSKTANKNQHRQQDNGADVRPLREAAAGYRNATSDQAEDENPDEKGNTEEEENEDTEGVLLDQAHDFPQSGAGGQAIAEHQRNAK